MVSEAQPIEGSEIVRVLSVGHAFVTFVVTFVAPSSKDAFVVKRVRVAMRENAHARELLANEADVLDALGGRSAPKLRARGEDRFGSWIAMDYVEGAPLRGLRDARAAFVALAELHDARIVHGDITPANVIVTDARATFIDFTTARSPRDGAFAGTIAFTAPEQARGEPIDARADLFSLAASLVAAEHARAPRSHGDLPLPLGARIAHAAERPLDDAFVALAPPPLVRCLAFDRDARAASARAVLAELC